MNNKTLSGTIFSLAIIFIIASNTNTNMQSASAFCLAFCAPQETQASASTNTKLLIKSNTDWSATVMDRTGNLRTIAGSAGLTPIDIHCSSVYSANVQKYSEEGTAIIALAKDGNLINQETTTAPYGIAQISGQCPR
jgi:hypothetical protein